ncbi:hypothetical protein F5Y14DRAFT_408741 [Nemania sp. NC0429]|nr:hypothetical protein F5Y14DRAFT_408741 [Nemania sp. NC0429]
MPHHRSFSDDKSSMKSTLFSQQPIDSDGSPYSSCTPSRSQSPNMKFAHRPKIRSPIPEQPEPHSSPDFTSSVPGSDRGGQSVAVNLSYTNVRQGLSSMPSKSVPSNSKTFSSLGTIGAMFDESHDSNSEGSRLSPYSDISSDEELNLEQHANQFLSENFGIRLSKLRRPNRVVDAFQQIKDQCIDILEDEGHQFGCSPRSEDNQSEPIDDGDTYQTTSDGLAYSVPTGSSSTSAGKKRPNHDTAEPDGLSGPSARTKGRRPKKPRIEGGLSCPYRKRNPRRFNVRDHAACANKAYATISELKKHITGDHWKKEACVCERCNQAFGTQDVLVAHLERCPYPPPTQPVLRYTDPEDGIDRRTEAILRSRKSTDQINNWEALWERLFPGDISVPTSEFEPVIENHDLLYTFKCSQSPIIQRLEEIFQLPRLKKRATLIQDIVKFLRCRGCCDANSTPPSNPATFRPRDIDVDIVGRESDREAMSLGPSHMAEVPNTEEPGQPLQGGVHDSFEFDNLEEIFLAEANSQYIPPVIPNNQYFFGLSQSALPVRETAQIDFSHYHELDRLQSSIQPQDAGFPPTVQGDSLAPHNAYDPFEHDSTTGWSNFFVNNEDGGPDRAAF